VQLGDGTTATLGGVGEVTTATAHRNKGVATTLLKLAISYMKAVGCDVSGLHAVTSAARLYRSLGFVAASMRTCGVPLGMAPSAVSTAKRTAFNDHLKAVLAGSTRQITFDSETARRLSPVSAFLSTLFRSKNCYFSLDILLLAPCIRVRNMHNWR
jgi:predicted acetyltransferase